MVRTDDRGSYEATFFRKGHYLVFVELEGDPREPYFEVLERSIEATPILDFHLPANRFTVKVTDRDTGVGIEDARVVSFNVSDEERSRRSKLATDEEGRVPLPPIESGELRIFAEADGYHRSEQVVIRVEAGEEERKVVLPLRPLGSTTSLRLLLPAGIPATGTDLLAVDSLQTGVPRWRAHADESGAVDVPDTLEGTFLLVRHPEAGFLVRRWEAGVAATWELPPKAPPLAVQVIEPWADDEPVPWARIALHQGGRWFRGPALDWLTSGRAAADGDGFWRAANLPPGPVRIVSWKPGRPTPSIEAVESLAATISYPWQGAVPVATVD